MTGPVAALERVRRARSLLLALSVAYATILAGMTLAGYGGRGVAVVLEDVSELAAALIACALCWATAARARHAGRSGWIVLGAACLSWAVGQAGWTYNEVLRGEPTPFPSPFDVAFLAFVPLASYAMLELAGPMVKSVGRLRVALDATLVGVGLLAVSWVLLLAPIVQESGTSVMGKLVGLAYPVTDVVLIAIAVSLISRGQPGDRRAFVLLGGGLLCFALADSAFAYLDLKGLYEGARTFTDAGWVLGFLLLGLAPLYFQGQGFARPPALRKYGSLVPHLVVIPVFLVFAALVFTGYRIDGPTSVLLLTLLLLAAVGQMVTNRENLGLAEDLASAAVRAHESEEAARRLMTRLEDAQRVSRMGTWEWDASTDEVWGTGHAAELWGDDSMRFPARLASILERVDPEDRASLVRALATATNGQGGFRLDVRMRNPGSSVRWLHLRGDAAADPAGRPRVTGTVHDVTERRESERRLQESRRLLEEAQSLARIGNWEYDVAEDRFELSPEMYRILGEDPNTYRPNLESFLGLVPEEDRPLVVAALRKLYGDRGAQDVEHRLVLPGGTTRWVHERAQGRLNEHGRVSKLFGTVHDITERKEAELEHERAVARERELQRLTEINDFKTQFINMAAHELRTPLTPIRVLLQTVRNRAGDALSKRDLDSLAMVDRNVSRLERLVEDLLSAARVQSQRLVPGKAPVNIRSLVSDSIRSFALVARQRDVTLTGTAAPGLVVAGDGGRLSQVLYNLLDNAIKFTPGGGHVSVDARAENDRAVVRVTDTGLGLRPDQLKGLFQPFSQVHDPDQAPPGGTGLGLYISRGIVEAHGGTLWCESAGPGAGATFTFSLPKAGARHGAGEAPEVPEGNELANRPEAP